MNAPSDNGVMESVLTRILRGSESSPRPEALDLSVRRDETEPMGDTGCIGWRDESGERVEVLELHQKSGAMAALPYSWMDFLEFEPSAGITIHARGSKVVIRGRNLNANRERRLALVQGIIHRRVSWIRESDRSKELTARESETFIEAITW